MKIQATKRFIALGLTLLLLGCNANSRKSEYSDSSTAQQTQTQKPSSVIDQIEECGYADGEVIGNVYDINCNIDGNVANGIIRVEGKDFLFHSEVFVAKIGDNIRIAYKAPADRSISEEINIKTGERRQVTKQRGKEFISEYKDSVQFQQHEDLASVWISLLETDGSVVKQNYMSINYRTK